MELFLELILVLLLIYLTVKSKFNDFVAQFEDIPRDSIVIVFGHCLTYMFKTPAEVLSLGTKAVKRLGGTALFIMGFNARIFITDPKDVEEILSNRKFSVKSDFYDFLEDWLGKGLVTSDGEKWFKRRKILSKSFHFKILEDFVEVFDKNGSILVDNLRNCEGEVIDMFPKIALCALDILCETSMGVEINAQTNAESSYVKAVKQIGEIAASRFFNILLQNKWIFLLTPTYIKQKRCLQVLHNFTDSVIIARREELLNELRGVGEIKNVEVENNRKLVIVDVLLQSTIDGEPLSNLDIREEVDTFMFAGHDTTTSGIAFCLYNLAKHPEIQDKVLNEVNSVMGDDINKPVTPQDIKDLTYLDLVIKESLRMFPPIPFFGRETQEDADINGKFIPKKTNLIIASVIMGQMENIWGDPYIFRPDRFLEDCSSTSPFASVAFSAGSRNCIGQKFAVMQMKTIISKILRNFEVLVPSDYSPILVAELVLRAENGMMLEFRRRKT